ncbi:DUF6252 family protein [Hymenobacter sp.]|uniref:DUF6252 family protein n=1 Tax=Hymenobacter sp. TaxID=1898978 RepID=UPI00286BE3EE|nr:DUF6252 family protein [Hymenobacter sp.]
MKALRNLSRYLLPLLCGGLLTLTACGSDDDDDNPAAAGDGTVTWTHSGTTYTSTVRSSAIVDSGDKIIVSAGSDDNKNILSLSLQGINAKGASVYDLRKGSVLDNLPAGVLNLNGSGGAGTTYNTLYGPNASNGSITVSQYDKASQKLSGTFSFTAGALPNTSATGTQGVTNGSFSFTKFR